MIKNTITITRDDISETPNVIKRLNKGSNKTNHKYNIDLDSLQETYQGLMRNRKFIKHYVSDDKLLQILFYCLDQENDHKNNEAVYYIRDIERLATRKNLYKLDRVNYWKCSFCGEEIEIDNSKKIRYYDLLCNNCKEEYEITDVIDKRILDNFNEYSNNINNNLKRKYKVILSKIKKNRK